MRKTDELKYDFSSSDLKKQQNQSRPPNYLAVKSTEVSGPALVDEFVQTTETTDRNDGQPLAPNSEVGNVLLVIFLVLK